MGYGYYEISRPDQHYDAPPMKRGYSIECKCHQRNCTERIDRGMVHLCYECTWYFCGQHLYCSPIEHECFAGVSSQICTKCYKQAEKIDEEIQQSGIGALSFYSEETDTS